MKSLAVGAMAWWMATLCITIGRASELTGNSVYSWQVWLAALLTGLLFGYVAVRE